MCRRRHSLRRSEFPLHPSVKLSHVIPGVLQARCSDSQGNRDTGLHLAGASEQNFAAADHLSGHSLSQEANADALGNRATSVPISLIIVYAVTTLTPGTSVRSTPTMR